MLLRKTNTTNTVGDWFKFSDRTVDRYGDIVEQNWELAPFLKNPLGLFGHRQDFVIGTWINTQVRDGALCGQLKMAPRGTSARIDEIRSLIEAGILRAVSVGFRPIESEPIIRTGGTRYIRSELLEVSIVAVPANPNALAISKKLGVSPEIMKMAFNRDDDVITSGRSRRLLIDDRSTISERIVRARQAVKKAKAALARSKAREKTDRVLGRVNVTIEKSRPPQKPQRNRYSMGQTWRGQKIPDGWRYPWYRRNVWDPES